jgi:hypothetical protein
MRKLIFIISISLLLANCRNKKNTKHQDNQETAMLIYNDTKDTTTVKYNQAIMELPEYKTWEYNYSNSDTTKKIGYSHFENRKIIFNGNVFYHIELFRQRFGKVTDSFINPEGIVYYFRIEPMNNIIRILNIETKEFLDLMSEEGRQYFQNSLKK